MTLQGMSGDIRRLPEIWQNALAKVVGKYEVTNVNEHLEDEQKEVGLNEHLNGVLVVACSPSEGRGKKGHWDSKAASMQPQSKGNRAVCPYYYCDMILPIGASREERKPLLKGTPWGFGYDMCNKCILFGKQLLAS